MFTDSLQATARRTVETIVAPLAAAGITPDMITVAGLLLNAGVAAVLATGSLALGGALLLVAGGFDMLDGALARRTQTFTVFGGFLDSTLDRFSEAFVLIGLTYFESVHHHALESTLLIGLLTGSFLISYTRARAEGLGLECKVGLLPRPERIIILAAGLLFPVLTPILIVLVVLTNLTALQRIVHVWKITRPT
ncbi:MAG TPA: CDP-alcohol phosphatidyltransferase family protein [Chloroflexota bacterium]|nr:CDP-alcohol phosphatidyltransferase family protein [Chloroflexota bacterium]